MKESVDSMSCYLPLIWKDSICNIYAVFVKNEHTFARDLLLENSKDSYL